MSTLPIVGIVYANPIQILGILWLKKAQNRYLHVLGAWLYCFCVVGPKLSSIAGQREIRDILLAQGGQGIGLIELHQVR
jgi:hypothetical protein